MRHIAWWSVCGCLCLALAACGGDSGAQGSPQEQAQNNGAANNGAANNGAANNEELILHEAPASAIELTEEPQRDGDAQRGYDYLVGGAYVGCGIPDRVWQVLEPLNILPGGPPAPGRQEELPYYLSRFDTPQGVEVIGPNCMTCHAGFINGELVMGLGGLSVDYGEVALLARELDDGLIAEVAAAVGLDQKETFELEKFTERMQAVAPYVRSETAGIANPADNLAAILFAHRDPQTLAWSPTPLLDPPSPHVVPVDTPPWWRMAKKNASLYVGAGRGDHARIMMAASTLCIDDVDTAREIDTHMPDVRAFIRSLEPPAWPYEVDAALAEQGERVFLESCTGCHGSYGEQESYPNLLIPLEEVGTDPELARSGSQFATRFVDWFNESFYGELSYLDPQEGYVAPPLDGVWATAPFLHNGSVPTLAALLDSSQRPAVWTWRYNTNDYDPEAMGWIHEVLPADWPESSNRRATLVYDTSNLGYGKQGHTYGDKLSAQERAALLEYLKTL